MREEALVDLLSHEQTKGAPYDVRAREGLGNMLPLRAATLISADSIDS